jgi:hypothetical protein
MRASRNAGARWRLHKPVEVCGTEPDLRLGESGPATGCAPHMTRALHEKGLPPMRTTRHPASRLFAGLLTAVLTSLTVIGTAGTASAEDAYAYWLYYTVDDGAFVYQENAGPATFVPEDGSVEAYRYAAALFPPTQKPRVDLEKVNFDTVCGDTAAEDGTKRVAVVIDYGIDGDAPNGDADAPAAAAECAVVATDATGFQTLQAVAKVRTDKDTAVCGVDGYPAAGDCFAKAEKASAQDAEPLEVNLGEESTDSADDDEDDRNLPMLLGAGVVVVLLGAGGVLLARRNKTAA